METLPATFNELIDMALEDANTVLSQPDKYVFNMGVWATRLISGQCMCCLAGAVITQRLVELDKLPSKVGIHNFSGDIKDKLLALNAFRLGDFEDSLLTFYVSNIYEYEEDMSPLRMKSFFDETEQLKGVYLRIAGLPQVMPLAGVVTRADLDRFLIQPGVVQFRSLLKELNL